MSSLQEMPTKLFIQMSDAPGSGEGTVAKLLEPHIGGVVIDHRFDLLEFGLIRFDQAAKQAYSKQWTSARELMKQGISVIVDSTGAFWTSGCALAAIQWRAIELPSTVGLSLRRPLVPAKTPTPNFAKWIEQLRRATDHAIILDSTDDPKILRNQILKQLAA